MTDEIEYYVVELAAEGYHSDSEHANEHTLALPIVGGPYESSDKAHREAQTQLAPSVDGYAPVAVPAGKVPDGWDEETDDELTNDE